MSETRNFSSPDMGQKLSPLSPDEKQELEDLRRRDRLMSKLDTANKQLSEDEKNRLKELEARPGGERPETLLNKLSKKE